MKKLVIQSTINGMKPDSPEAKKQLKNIGVAPIKEEDAPKPKQISGIEYLIRHNK